MTRYIANFEVLNVEFLKNSALGNPKAKLILKDEKGAIIEAKTATNAPSGYQIGYTTKSIKARYHFTKNYNMLIDYIIEKN